MKTRSAAHTVVTRLNSLILFGVLIIAAAVVAVPVYSVRSSSLPQGSARATVPSGAPASASRIRSLTTLAPWSETFRPLLPIPTSSPETIETLSSDCTTPKTAFVLGEQVCVVVNFVTESDRFVNWLSPPSSTVVFSSPTIPDNASHSYTYTPLVAGTWKATIADPSDSSIIPTVFTVQSQSGSLQTFAYVAGNCTTTPKVSFNLGERVCATITGAGQPANGRATTRIGWVSPYGSLAKGTEIVSNPQSAFYDVPNSATQTFTDEGGGTVTVDNRGQWRLCLLSALDGSLIESTNFTVHDPAKAFVDLSVHQSTSVQESVVGSGSGSVFKIFVTNTGPDTAHDVVVSDTVPANTTFTSAVEEDTNLGFTCGTPVGGVFECTLANMAAGATAQLTFAYDVMAGTPAGTILTNAVTVASSATPCAPDPTCDLRPDDNSSIFTSRVPETTGTETCTLLCHASFSVVANAVQGGNPGAFVSFGAASPFGNCGAITATFPGLPVGQPASGAFYPVGTTLVSVSSETGGGNCSFTITVVEGTPPTISCPPDKTATDDGSGSHTFTAAEIGTPTTDPSTDVIVTFERSDNIPATYDANGDVVTPEVVHPLTYPFSTGTTGITWTVTDANGLAASCTQRITVHAPCATDTQPPTITAPADINVGTGPNSTTCGVALSPSDGQLGEPIVNDDCSATVTITGVPAGNLFPVGMTILTYTATDGAGHTASDTQTVTVFDNTPPAIVAPANASYVCPSEVPVANVSQAHGNNPDLPNGGPVFDNCGLLSVTVSDSSTGAGSVASPLVITRTYTATDIHGNSASSVQIITVIDPTPPTFTFVPGDVTANTGPTATTCDAVVNPGTATATDNCGVVNVTRSPSGNTFPVGTTTITWTATDGAGNTTTATQNVTVIDNTAPVITTNGQTPSMWPPNHDYQTFQVTNFVTSVFDNCGGVTVNDVVIQKVTSDEAEDADADGATLNDIVIAADCKSVQLRAERSGTADGRVYTITFRLTDTHGNTTTTTAKVVVVHNTGETAVDSGAHYTVNSSCFP
jgi:uncharacterized repeat protein (TIGR01451 family)